MSGTMIATSVEEGRWREDADGSSRSKSLRSHASRNCWGQQSYEEVPEEQYWGEEGGVEYAAFNTGPRAKVQGHSPEPTQTAEDGVLYQPLG